MAHVFGEKPKYTRIAQRIRFTVLADERKKGLGIREVGERDKLVGPCTIPNVGFYEPTEGGLEARLTSKKGEETHVYAENRAGGYSGTNIFAVPIILRPGSTFELWSDNDAAKPLVLVEWPD